jgi:hypothetical protein
VPTVCRVIVGASGSPGSLRALRYAQHLARDLDATLVPVLAWLPPGGDLADRRTPNARSCAASRPTTPASGSRTRRPRPGEHRPTTRQSGPWPGAASPARSWPVPPATPATC